MASLLLGALGVSTTFGMLLLLPLYVQELGGDEAAFGRVASAGTVTAALAIGALIRRPDRLPGHVVSALAVAVYALAALAVGTVGTYGPLIPLGVLLGTAWALVYTSMPMVMSSMVGDAERAAYFGYLTGTQQIGIGLGPVLGRQLLEAGLGFRQVFLVGGLVCLAAAALTLWTGRLASRSLRRRARGEERPELATALRKIVSSDTAPMLVMIILFACLFATMTFFQTTFARARGLDFSIFYVSYTVSVIVSRVVIATLARGRDQALVIAVSVSVMAIGLASFLSVGSSPFVYAGASAMLGLGYGLALPTVQAHAVNVSKEDLRPRVLPLAGLVFMTAILGFPILAGALISAFGYGTLFSVLLGFAGVQALIAWSRLGAGRRVLADTAREREETASSPHGSGRSSGRPSTRSP